MVQRETTVVDNTRVAMHRYIHIPVVLLLLVVILLCTPLIMSVVVVSSAEEVVVKGATPIERGTLTTMPPSPMMFSPTGYHIFAEHRYTTKNHNSKHDEDNVHYVPQAVCHGNHCSRARLPTSIQCSPISKKRNQKKINKNKNKIVNIQQEGVVSRIDVRIPAAITFRHGGEIVGLLEEYRLVCETTNTPTSKYQRNSRVSYNFSCGTDNDGVPKMDSELLRLLGTNIMHHYSSSSPSHQAGHPGDALRLIGHTVEGLSLSDMRTQRGYLQSGRTINFNSDYTPSSSSSASPSRPRAHQRPSSGGRLDQIFKKRAMSTSNQGGGGGDDVVEAQYNDDVIERGSTYRPHRGKGGSRHLEDDDGLPSDANDVTNEDVPTPEHNIPHPHPHHHTPHLHIPMYGSSSGVGEEDEDEVGSDEASHHDHHTDEEKDADADDDIDTVVVGWECVLTPPSGLDDHYTYEDAHVLCLGAEQDGAVMTTTTTTTTPTDGSSHRTLRPLYLRSIFDFIPNMFTSDPTSTNTGIKMTTTRSSRAVAMTSSVDASVGAVCTIHYRIINYGPLAPKIAFGILLIVTVVFGGSMFFMMFPKDPREEAAAKKRKQLKRRYEVEMALEDKLLKERRELRSKRVGGGKRGDMGGQEEDDEGGDGFSVDEAMLRQLGIESRDATGIPNYHRSTAAVKSSFSRPTRGLIPQQQRYDDDEDDMVHHRRPFMQGAVGGGSGESLANRHHNNPNNNNISQRIPMMGSSSNHNTKEMDDTTVAASLYNNPRGLSLGQLIGAAARSGGGDVVEGSGNNNMRMMGRGSASTTTTSVGRRLGGPIVPLDAARLVSSHDPSHNHQRWEMDSNSDVPGGHHHTAPHNNNSAAAHPNDHRNQQHTYLPIPHTPDRSGAPPPTGDTYPIDKW